MRKKLLLILLALVSTICMALAFASCDFSSNSNQGENTNQTQPETPMPPQPTKGIDYSLSLDGKYYSVMGIGTATDTDIIIPETLNNIPITILA